MKNKQLPFYISIISIFIIIVSPSLFSDGMFMDGLYYATVSHNLANDIGTFSYLHFSETTSTPFIEHPPLVFWLQSLFFKLFGDNILIERFYSLLTYIFSAIGIHFLWSEITSKKQKSISWLPILFWLFTPIVTWACSNNMLENTMTFFLILATLYIFRSTNKHRFTNTYIGGLFIFLAFMSKGFVGLFPLSLYFWIWIVKRDSTFLKMLENSLMLLMFLISNFIILYIVSPETISSLVAYINHQVIGSINNVETVNYRFSIIVTLINQLLPILLITSLFTIIYSKFVKHKFKINISKNVWITCLLGLSAVAPIMVSLKQNNFYVLPSIPFFSIGLALIISNQISDLINKINFRNTKFKIFIIISFLLLIISISIIPRYINTVGRDKETISDIKQFLEIIPTNTIIGISPEIRTNWSVQAYFYRYSYVSLDAYKNKSHKYLLLTKNKTAKNFDNFKEIKLETNKYILLKKNNE